MSSFTATSVWAYLCSWFAAVWSGVNNPVIVIAVMTVGVVLPVVYVAITTTILAFSQDDSAPPPPPPPPSTAAGRNDLEMIEEGLPIPPPPNVLEMTFSNVQPVPQSREFMMLRMIKTMYILLAQTLVGSTTSLSPVERMNAACSIVARTVANLGGWRAPVAVVALLQPAKGITDLFSSRCRKGGSGEMKRGRQVHCAALLNRLNKRANKMEEVIDHALWARIMPTVPANLRGARAVVALLDKTAGDVPITGSNRAKTRRSHGTRRGSGTMATSNPAVAPGVQYVPYSGPSLPVHSCRGCQAAESGGGLLQ